jgi:ketosteroid isomerase-like protein
MTQGAAVLHVRDDKVTRLVGYSDSHRALAVGLAAKADPKRQ